MNLLKLEVLVLMNQFKKVSSVADQLGLKQPTVTFHMRSLEEDLGIKLFETRGGRISLTEAGQALHHYARKIIALTKEARHAVNDYDKKGKGSFRIGASYVPGTYLLPKVLGSLSRTFPEASVTLIFRTAPVIQQMLLTHEIDVGVISSESFDEENIVKKELCEDQLVLIFAPEHSFGGLGLKDGEIHANRIAKEPFIYHHQASTTRRMTEKWAEEHGVTLNPRMELESLEAIKQAVQYNEGVSFVSYLAVEKEVKRGELGYAELPHHSMKRFIYIAYNRDRWLTNWLQVFIERMEEVGS